VLKADGTFGTSNAANGYHFVGVSSKDMGTVRFGRLNTASLGAWGVGSVYGTALGSGYATNGNMYTVGSSSAANFNQTAPTRFNGAIEYTSPAINGFTARALFVPKVDNTGPGSTDASSGGLTGVNRAGVTDFGLAYNAGPLNIAVAQQNHKFGANAIAAVATPGASSSVVNGDYKLTTMAANYTMGAATVYGMYWTEKQATVATSPAAVKLDAVGTQFGVKYVVGAISYSAAYSKREDKSTADVTNSGVTSYSNADRTTVGLGADYALSKRTSLWARYQAVDPNTNRSGVNTTQTGNAVTSFDKVTTTAVGVRHTF
jgi:GBP family porin